MHALTVNNQMIACRHAREGGGPCIVFVHPPGCDQSFWDDVRAALPRGYDTLTYDLRGHGLSELSEGFTAQDLRDDLICLIEALDLRDVTLCAASAGAVIAQLVTATRPKWLKSLVLSGPMSASRVKEWLPADLGAATAGAMDPVAASVLEGWLPAPLQREQPGKWQLLTNMIARTHPTGFLAVLEALRAADLTDEPSTADLATLCIAGSEDRMTPAGATPGPQIEVLAGVGHLPAIEAPAEMAALMADFMSCNQDRTTQGMSVRRAVLGNAHVDRAEKAKTDFDKDFQTLITESAWGTVWASPGISRRERSMLTLALLAAMGNFDEIPMHVRACARTGASASDIREAFQHVAIYAGVPRANHALKIARKTLDEMTEGTDG